MSVLRIIVFAKAPVPGLAKTRLIPQLGADGAAQLASRLLQHTLTEARAANVGKVELCVTPAAHSECWSGVVIPPDVDVSDQGEGDLGERLARAASRGLASRPYILLVGADCPELTRERLRAAAKSLRASDVVIFPASDGGYTLLGLRRTDSSLFDDVPWSTAAVAAMTAERVRKLGWSLHFGKTLHDIDVPADLDHVPQAWLTHDCGLCSQSVLSPSGSR